MAKNVGDEVGSGWMLLAFILGSAAFFAAAEYLFGPLWHLLFG